MMTEHEIIQDLTISSESLGQCDLPVRTKESFEPRLLTFLVKESSRTNRHKNVGAAGIHVCESTFGICSCYD